jgi:hypothetical protein
MSLNVNIDQSVFNYKKGKIQIETNGKTIGEALNYSAKRRPGLKKAIFDESGNLCSSILIKVNGKFVFSNQLTTSVKDGETIEVLKNAG